MDIHGAENCQSVARQFVFGSRIRRRVSAVAVLLVGLRGDSPCVVVSVALLQSNSSLRALRAAIFPIFRPTRITIATVRRLSLPIHPSRDLNGASRVASTSAVTKKCVVNGLVVCNTFSAAFTLKHRERKQASARRHGGLLLRSSAPTGSWFLPLRRPLQESRPWHLGAASRSRPPGGVP